ncbi:biotin carboxylase [Allocatelliglobosispora scoriae]|uniref:Biotin carboxylase n=1 Tax=Allocatelliglobosispora scoriae TaxID=643052 RepID=A0A841BXB9_9ACTN|nr:ATP-grasp domain-containing protein [Allocatelliglobosispora scoriae]MBB5872804.1 biotin carboxylase [Allocatelliglobosispora scoriae]
MDDALPLLVIYRTGPRKYREYLLRSISSRYRIHMFVGVEPSWENDYISGHTLLGKNLDPEVATAAARDLHAREPISGMMCWDEARIAQTAFATDALGLPGPGAAAIGRCRDKHQTRAALAAAGVPQPRSIRVDSLDEATAAAAEIGYPVILKPSDLVASKGVVRVDSPADLPEHFAATHAVEGGIPGYQARVLVEEYVPGDEISVDSVIHGGRVTVLVLARKVISEPPWRIEMGHFVDADDPLRTDPALLAILHDTHAAIGFDEGVTHTEIKLSPDGPKVIEVNGRLGGGLIPYLGLLATGVDTGLAAADAACGVAPSVEPDRTRSAGIRFFAVSEPATVITSIGFDEALLPPTIVEATVSATVGEVLSPPTYGNVSGRIAYAIAVADTPAECRAALDLAAKAFLLNAP